ncbi:MAG TPA: glycosyltransferase [Candidatus Angelobacter sp.]|nr:glycosyltransferase [Candidatus Angelobacter sp.]
MVSLSLSIFTVAMLAAVYFTLGYPLVLAGRAHFFPNPVCKTFFPRTVSVVMAVRNGDPWIADKLASILDQNYPRELVEIIVVSDGSTDGTDEIASRFSSYGVEVLRIESGGKAVALNKGMQRAKGDVLFFNDVRQRIHPDCLRHLVACLGDPNVGAACGQTLFLAGEERPHLGMYWRYERWLRRSLSQVDSLLAGTCFFVVRRDLVEPMPPGTLLDDSWLPLSAFLRGYRFVLDTEAIAWDYPNALRSEFKRKVRTLAGIYQLVMFRPQLLSAQNRMRFHFISYRLGRVLLPYLLLVAFASSFTLSSVVRGPVLGAWLALLVFALADVVLPEGLSVKLVTSAARTFVVLMAASFCAVAIFFVPPTTLWQDAWTDKKQVPEV